MTLTVYLPVIGDRFTFGWPFNWEFAVDQTILLGVADHEQVHVNTCGKVIGTLFPKIEFECVGKCLPKPWFSSWTPEKCQKAWEAKIRSEMQWAANKNEEINLRWDAMDKHRSFRDRVAETVRDSYYQELDSKLADWKKHRFCK